MQLIQNITAFDVFSFKIRQTKDEENLLKRLNCSRQLPDVVPPFSNTRDVLCSCEKCFVLFGFWRGRF